MSASQVSARASVSEDGHGPDTEVLVEASRSLIQQGELEEAERLLQAAVRAEPDRSEAWLGLASLAGSSGERKALLRRALALDPGNAQARAGFARLEQPQRASRQAIRESRKRLLHSLWIVPLLVVTLTVAGVLMWGTISSSLAWLLPAATPTPTPDPTSTPAEIAGRFIPQLEAALLRGDWRRALEITGIMNGLDPSAEQVRYWSVKTHLQYGQALAQGGHATEAKVQFDKAAQLAPGDAEVRLWQDSTGTYLIGLAALESGDWKLAIQAFDAVYGTLPSYGDVFYRLVQSYRSLAREAAESADWTTIIDMLAAAPEQVLAEPPVAEVLAEAYRKRGILLQSEGKLKKARLDLEAALTINPDDVEAQAHLDEVMYKLFPPKRIEIDISKQRLYAWEGDAQVYRFVVSTGLPGQDTASGHFQVLDKIRMAYSSIWRLKMPYWLGIYYVGGIENGIHALPIRPDGSVMWGGLLGQRASYGCIILDTKDAKTLYNWAEIGTKVNIHY